MPSTFEANVLSWDHVENAAVAQAREVGALPFVPCHVALLPGSVKGLGTPWGSVVLPSGVAMPSAVENVGAGAYAVRLGCRSTDLPERIDYLEDILEEVSADSTVLDIAGGYKLSLGLDLDTDEVWVLTNTFGACDIHREHLQSAQEWNAAFLSETCDTAHAHIPVAHSPFFEDYIADVEATQFDHTHVRVSLANAAIAAMIAFGVPGDPLHVGIESPSNSLKLEEHGGATHFVARKGAISAQHGELGIIPAHMGSTTHIVRGLNGPGSYSSASALALIADQVDLIEWVATLAEVTSYVAQ